MIWLAGAAAAALLVRRAVQRGGGAAPVASGEELGAPFPSAAWSSDVSLELVRAKAEAFAIERAWTQFHSPRNVLLAMVAEVGELSEIFQWRGECQPNLPSWREKDRVHLGEELSDVLIYLVRLSDRCGVDLSAAVLRKFAMNARKYPVGRAYGTSKKYNAL